MADIPRALSVTCCFVLSLFLLALQPRIRPASVRHQETAYLSMKLVLQLLSDLCYMVSSIASQCCFYGVVLFLFFCFFLQILRFSALLLFFLVHSTLLHFFFPNAASMEEVDRAIRANDVPRLVAALNAPGPLLLWTIILPERRTKANVLTSLQ